MFATAKQIHAGGHELQDRAEIFWSGTNLVLVVADGAGGRSGAAEAAEFVTRRVKQTIHSADLSSAGLAEFLRLIDGQMAKVETLAKQPASSRSFQRQALRGQVLVTPALGTSLTQVLTI